MPHVQLIHWNALEARERGERLKAMGCSVRHEASNGPSFLRQLRENPPIAAVIDLTRLPSQGRDIALAIRQARATRRGPLVFVEGEPGTVARIRQLLPDAVYTTWRDLRASLKQAIERPPENPVVPGSVLAGYAGQPLLKKLGLREGMRVALINAPANFKETLGALPDGVRLRGHARGASDLMLWFLRSRADLDQCVARMAPRDDVRSLWMIWPKKASQPGTELTQPVVRRAGLAAGLVDYKVCSIDATWTGLLFTWRKTQKKSQGG
jgi:hypothetical protein